MRTLVTSQPAILAASRALLRQQGWPAVNIRAVAAACGVSVGSIYNHFPSKADLISATVESIWQEIFPHPDEDVVLQDTLACLRWLYQQLSLGHDRYPGFFTLHSVAFLPETKADGKRRMQQSWDHIQRALTAVLTRDPNVRPDAFAGDLTPEQFAQVLFSLLLSALLRQDYDPAAALALARTVLY